MTRSPTDEATLKPPLYAVVFQRPGQPPTGIRVQPDGRVLSSGDSLWDGDSWLEAFTLNSDQLHAMQQVLDAADVTALQDVTPPVGDRSSPPPDAVIQLIQHGEPITIHITGYTPEGAPALEALHHAVESVWAGSPVSTRVQLPDSTISLACDPTAVLPLRDVLFPIIDLNLPSADASDAPPLISVEWWQDGARMQRYVLHVAGRVQRQVPGRSDEWRQLPADTLQSVAAILQDLNAERLRAGCSP